jgi:hypothetical protein
MIRSMETGEQSIEEQARESAGRLREVFEKMERVSNPGGGLGGRAAGPMKESFRQEMIAERAILIGFLDSIPENDERLEYLKLVVDCDQYLDPEDRTREV